MPPLPFRTIAFMLVVIAVLWTPTARAASECTAAAPLVWTNLSLPQPVVDNSRTRAEIQQKAEGIGDTVGLYVGVIKTAVQVGFATSRAAGQTCVAVSVVTLDLAVADRHIYLAREWPPGSCPYRAILAHERKHQAADDKAARTAAQAIHDEIIKTVASIGPLLVPADQADAAQKRLYDAVTGAFHMGTARLLLDQGRLQQAVDAGVEYARLTASCAEFGNGYTPYPPPPPSGTAPPMPPGWR